MEIDFNKFDDSDLTIISYEKVLGLPDLLAIADEFYKNPSLNVILDLTKTKISHLKSEEIISLVEHLHKQPVNRNAGRTAIAVSDTGSFNAARDFALALQSKGLKNNVRVFYTLSEAKLWMSTAT